MTAIKCPKCGYLRTIEQIFSADGWHNPDCAYCGDPGWTNPAVDGLDDPFEGYAESRTDGPRPS